MWYRLHPSRAGSMTPIKPGPFQIFRDPDCWKKANLASAFFEPNNVAFGSSLRHKNHDAAGSHQVEISGNCNLCARVPNVTRRQERSIERAIPTSSGNRWQLKIQRFPVHIHHDMNVRVLLEAGEGNPKCSRIWIIPARTEKATAMPHDIDQPAVAWLTL